MGEISAVTVGTTAGAEQAAASVAGLARLATDLRHSVAAFRLPGHEQGEMEPGAGGGFEQEPALISSLSAASD
jgi:hypothetical protein